MLIIMLHLSIKEGEAETYLKRYTTKDISKSALASKQGNKPIKKYK